MTVEAISNLSGVSKATVSRVLNGHPGVQLDKVQAVQSAAQKLKYQIKTRKPRVSRKTKTIAMLSVEQDIFAYYKSTGSYVFRGIEKGLAERGINLVLGRATSIESLPSLVTTSQVDGLILSGMRFDPKVMAKIEHFPHIWISSHWSEQGCEILPGNERICSLVVDHMIRKGHQQVAFANVFKRHPVLSARAEYFEFTANRQGITTHMYLDDTKLRESEIESMEAWQQLEQCAEKQILEMMKLPHKITSLFVPMGALVALYYRVFNRLGLRPGVDIEVISCGSIEEVMEIYPRPAIVDIAPFIMGQRAVEMLLNRIDSPTDDRAVHLVVEPKLIEAEVVNAPQ